MAVASPQDGPQGLLPLGIHAPARSPTTLNRADLCSQQDFVEIISLRLPMLGHERYYSFKLASLPVYTSLLF